MKKCLVEQTGNGARILCSPRKALFALGSLSVAMGLSGCFNGESGKDLLREPIATEGISMGLQVNLAKNASVANTIASIYKDGKRQPLVGGDYFSATASSTGEQSVLRSIDNLEGDYLGTVGVSGLQDSVVVKTEYDAQVARQDRWYPTDQLLVDPGPDTTLVGYEQSFRFPDPVTLSVAQTEFTDRSGSIDISWTPGNGEQMLSNALVSCRNSGGEAYTYSRVYRHGADSAGSVSISMSELIPNQDIINVGVELVQQVYSLMSVAVSASYGFGILQAVDIPLSRFTIQSCDIDLTLYREIAVPKPANVSGGFAIASTSDSLKITYTP